MNDKLKNEIMAQMDYDLSESLCFYLNEYADIPREELMAVLLEVCEKTIKAYI